MIRKIIEIDKNLCDGCGICVDACHEGAIGLVDGKAHLLRDDYCDGLGDCLPVCPTGAISFTTREAAEYDEAAVQKNMNAKKENEPTPEKLPCGCPGTNSKTIDRKEYISPKEEHKEVTSKLSQWPVQIKLIPTKAPYLNGANLLIAADCTAYAYGNFHNEFIQNRITLIGCPKLDEGDYAEKLTDILKYNDIKSVTVVRMEVPCCAGIANATIQALKDSEKMIPWQVVTISTDGQIVE